MPWAPAMVRSVGAAINRSVMEGDFSWGTGFFSSDELDGMVGDMDNKVSGSVVTV